MNPVTKCIFLITATTLLCSCERQEAPQLEELSLIQLQAEHPTSGVTSRGAGPIEKWRDTPLGLFIGRSSKTYTEVWNATVNVFGNVNITGTPSYYPDNQPIYIAAYYPVSETFNEDQTVTYTGLDGTDDLMISAEVSASSRSPFNSSSRLTFTHLLTQLGFEISSPSASDLFPSGLTITRITVRPAETNSQPFYTTAAVDITRSPKQAIMMSGEKTDSLVAYTGSYTVTTTPTTIGNILLPPAESTAGYQIEVNLTLSDGTVIPLQPITAGFQQDLAYKVKLSFVGTTLTSSVPTVTPWIGGGGLPTEYTYE